MIAARPAERPVAFSVRAMPMSVNTSTADRAIAVTRAWVQRAVVGLNLCPVAKAPLV